MFRNSPGSYSTKPKLENKDFLKHFGRSHSFLGLGFAHEHTFPSLLFGFIFLWARLFHSSFSPSVISLLPFLLIGSLFLIHGFPFPRLFCIFFYFHHSWIYSKAAMLAAIVGLNDKLYRLVLLFIGLFFFCF